MNKPEVSIILPSLNRYQKLGKVLDNIAQTTQGINLEYIILLSEEDKLSQAEVKARNLEPILTPSLLRPVELWNMGARVSQAEWLYLGSDDVIHPPNWLRKCLSTPNQGFIGIGDGKVVPNWAPFFIVSKSWCRAYQGGVFVVPHYKHWGLDPEITERAVRSGTFTLAPIYLEHMHYIFKRSPKDSTYKRAEEYHQIDVDLFKHRRELGFPNDFEGFL